MPPPSQPPDVEGRRGRSAPSPEDEEDAALIRKAALGDRGAFETLYGRLAPSLMAFAYHLTRDRGLSEDAVQEAFLRAWQAAPRFDPSRGRGQQFLPGNGFFREPFSQAAADVQCGFKPFHPVRSQLHTTVECHLLHLCVILHDQTPWLWPQRPSLP